MAFETYGHWKKLWWSDICAVGTHWLVSNSWWHVAWCVVILCKCEKSCNVKEHVRLLSFYMGPCKDHVRQFTKWGCWGSNLSPTFQRCIIPWIITETLYCEKLRAEYLPRDLNLMLTPSALTEIVYISTFCYIWANHLWFIACRCIQTERVSASLFDLAPSPSACVLNTSQPCHGHISWPAIITRSY